MQKRLNPSSGRFGALEVFLNDMRYINPRFTYLLTYILLCRGVHACGVCSYRVRGVDGSRAEHLTVESYTVFYAADSRNYYY